MTYEGLGEDFNVTLQTCARKNSAGILMGAKWRVKRAQTRERGPPSEPAEFSYNPKNTRIMNISISKLIFFSFRLYTRMGSFRNYYKRSIFFKYPEKKVLLSDTSQYKIIDILKYRSYQHLIKKA